MPSRGLSPQALRRVCDAVAPGGAVVRVRPLRGGISSSVHLVNIRAADGNRQAVVVRRYGDYYLKTDPQACEREFKLLTLLARTSFPAPRPLLLDAQGGSFGAPTVLMTRVPGKPVCAPRDLPDYLAQMARVLADLHRLSTDGMQFLPDQATYVDRALTRQAETSDALLADVRRAAMVEWHRISQRAEPRVLVHGDYWPGNLVWRRGRLIGVVDWEQPRLGDPTKDVATCRGDLAVLFGQEVADDFVRLYAASGGHPMSNLRFWDLLVSSWALPEMPEWAVAYRVLGRPDLTSEVAVARIRAFASNALQRA